MYKILIAFLFLTSCSTTKKVYYCDLSAPEIEMGFTKKEYEKIKNLISLNPDSVNVTFNPQAFKGPDSILYINKPFKDILKFKNELHPAVLYRNFSKKYKYILINYRGSKLKIPIKKEYDYINVSYYKKSWSIKYCKHIILYKSR